MFTPLLIRLERFSGIQTDTPAVPESVRVPLHSALLLVLRDARVVVDALLLFPLRGGMSLSVSLRIATTFLLC